MKVNFNRTGWMNKTFSIYTGLKSLDCICLKAKKKGSLFLYTKRDTKLKKYSNNIKSHNHKTFPITK